MEASGHTVGKAWTSAYQSSNDKSLGRKTESCNFSALVMPQGAAPLFLNTPAMTPCLNVGFFFLPVPCALEAQTVINTSCFDWRFPRKREKVRQRSRCHQQYHPCLNVGRAARYRSTGSWIQSALMVPVNIRMLLTQSPSR